MPVERGRQAVGGDLSHPLFLRLGQLDARYAGDEVGLRVGFDPEHDDATLVVRQCPKVLSEFEPVLVRSAVERALELEVVCLGDVADHLSDRGLVKVVQP